MMATPDGRNAIDLSDDQLAVEMDAAAAYARDVDRETYRLRVKADAARKVAQERVDALGAVPVLPLGDFLAVLDPDVAYRVDQLWPIGGRIVLAAQFKAGKTTLVGNLLRSLVDGEPFLGRYTVDPVRKVVLIDTEMDQRTLRRWLRDQEIRNVDRVAVVPLRGRVSALDLLDADTCADWADRLAGADVVILDCLRPVLDALGLDESREAGRLLVALDQLLVAAGVSEAMIVHHMGHTHERSRGDSRIIDWPDATWTYVRHRPDQDDDDTESARLDGPRYLAAYGRDVNLAESRLDYEPDRRRLAFGGGSRRDGQAEGDVATVLELLADGEPRSGRKVEDAAQVAGLSITQRRLRAALRRAVRNGQVLTEPGERRAILHRLNPASESVHRSASAVQQRAASECVSAPIGGAHTLTHADDAGQCGTDPLNAQPCPNPSHSPRLVDGRWTCPDCQTESGAA